MKRIIAFGYPRLHWSLVDMSGASKRMYGGFGVAVKAYATVATAEPDKELYIETNGSIEDRTRDNLIKALNRARAHGLNINCKLNIKSEIKPHAGFGSATQIILTAMDAVSILNDWHITPEQIIEMSGRGRVSLISYSTHYYGGFCIDAGQPYDAEREYLPSHTPGDRKPSLFIGSWRFPEEWKISLLGENSDVVVPAEKEDDFMRSHTPLDKHRGVSSIVELYHGILPSVIEKNYAEFTDSLKSIQCLSYKSAELSVQNEKTLSALDMLWERNYAAALSSNGPLLSVVHFDNNTDEIIQLAKECGLSYSGPYDVIQKHAAINPFNPFIRVYQ